ncbi:MAG: DeoR/GlpR transcriptional regulator [Clostridiales bacterium]|nr:DeoR/GlpR transcriptional regulator [Clostridiales bacterium]
MDAVERRQQILELLCQRRKDTMQNLAAELGVSERTIRRDVEILTRSYPLETVCGRYGGGVRVADWYHLDRQRMSPRQTALLRRLAADLRGEDLEVMEQILLKFAS